VPAYNSALTWTTFPREQLRHVPADPMGSVRARASEYSLSLNRSLFGFVELSGVDEMDNRVGCGHHFVVRLIAEAMMIAPPRRCSEREAPDLLVAGQAGEWRGTSQSRALSEPDVNLPIHPAPIIQPQAPGSSGRTW
jgi:hypothetical protein